MSNLSYELSLEGYQAPNGLQIYGLDGAANATTSTSLPQPTLGDIIRLVLLNGQHNWSFYRTGVDLVAFDLRANTDWSLVDHHFRQRGCTPPPLSIVGGGLLLNLYPERAVTLRYVPQGRMSPDAPTYGTVHILEVGPDSGYAGQSHTPNWN